MIGDRERGVKNAGRRGVERKRKEVSKEVECEGRRKKRNWYEKKIVIVGRVEAGEEERNGKGV
jgi:hypothetical protein